jgi:hypothetical protein
MIAGLTWPCKLPPCWSVVWDESSAGADSDTQEWCLVRALSRCLIIASCHLLLPLNNELSWTVVVKNFCNPISLSELFCYNLNSAEYSECMKCVLMYSPKLIFVSVIACEILVFSGFNWEFTRGTAEFYASWIGVVLQRWLAHWVESFRAVPPQLVLELSKAYQRVYQGFSNQKPLKLDFKMNKFSKIRWIIKEGVYDVKP